MKANGRITWPMEGERRFIVMKASTMESSLTIKDTETESLCRISASLRDSLSVISCKALLPCRIKTDRAILDNGRITKNMVKELISGQTVIDTKDSISAERGKVLELCSMPTDRPTKDIG
jgi:hypothetical protein